MDKLDKLLKSWKDKFSHHDNKKIKSEPEPEPEPVPTEEDTTWECPVCLDNINFPLVMGCGHSICMECIQGLIKQECPKCRKQIVTIAANYALGYILDLECSHEKLNQIQESIKKRITQTSMFFQSISQVPVLSLPTLYPPASHPPVPQPPVQQPPVQQPPAQQPPVQQPPVQQPPVQQPPVQQPPVQQYPVPLPTVSQLPVQQPPLPLVSQPTLQPPLPPIQSFQRKSTNKSETSSNGKKILGALLFVGMLIIIDRFYLFLKK